jgi:NADH-quinone oxidoreductase subunit H
VPPEDQGTRGMNEYGWLERAVHTGAQRALYGAAPWLPRLVPVLCILGFVAVAALMLIWLERKISADIQSRVGPVHHGPYGLLQTVWDAIKLVVKEDVVPLRADKIVFCVAPYIAFVPTVLLFCVIPFGKGWMAADLNVGLFYIVAMGSTGVIGIIIAGWASNNKWSLIGGMRAAAQLITYEIPGFLAVVTIVMLTGTLSMRSIVVEQAGGAWGLSPLSAPFLKWHCFTLPGFIAAGLYLISALAEVNRTPFDLPEAESELVCGFNTEYSGFRFGAFFVGEFANMALVSAIATTLFFGGWSSPIVSEGTGIWAVFGDGVLWFFAKVAVLIYGMMWIKWTLPRVRIDQMLKVAWKGLIPIGLANLLIAMAWVAVAGWPR